MAVCASMVAALLISLASSLAFSVAADRAAAALPPAFFSILATAPSVFLVSAFCSPDAAGGGGGGADAEFIVLALGAELITDIGEVTEVADVVDGAATTESTVALPVADTALAGSLR